METKKERQASTRARMLPRDHWDQASAYGGTESLELTVLFLPPAQ